MKRTILGKRYYDLITSLDKIILVIIGKDPFPTNATGIPFCKSEWKDQISKNSSGRVVLESLGITLENTEHIGKNPADLFMNLARNGIVFLNISYDTITGKMQKIRDAKKRSNAIRTNKPIINKAEIIILCGEAKKWNITKHSNIIELIHPDPRNKINRYKKVRQEWNETWGENQIKERYKLNITT